MPTIIISGDICPIESNRPHFRRGDAVALANELLPELQRADLAIANLECPLIETPSPISKTGPTFGVECDCVNGLKALNFHVVGLANNHSMDHGPAGLRNTMEVCARAGISTVGAGQNLAAARQLVIRNVGGIRVAILAVAEHEFSISADRSWGANPLDLATFVRTIRAERANFDFLIVLLHGSHEFFIPTPRIKDTCHFMVELGANAVIVQHPHCVGGIEEYEGGHIVYGQGAFLMDEAIYRDLVIFHEGFLVKLTIGADIASRMELVPYLQASPPPGARRMTPEQESAFRRRLAERSEAIRDDAFVDQEWLQFCEARKYAYMSGLLGHNRLLRKLNGGGWLMRLIYGKRQLLSVRNMVCCDTHREAIATIFDRKLL